MTVPGGTIARAVGALLGASALLAVAAPAASAQSVVVRGRVEDAEWREPLEGVLVFAPDSSSAVLTDSLGRFSLLMPSGGPFTVRAERLGYRPDEFELGEGAPSRVSVLLLQAAPVELAGVEVVTESAVSEVLRDLRRRRNAYLGAVSVFDRVQLDRLAPFGTVWDFVRRRTFQVYECFDALSGLCTRERGRRSLRFGPREIPVRVCIDGRDSWGAVAEMRSLDIESVAMVELYSYGRGGIRIYTPGYIASSARAGRNIAPFGDFGC